MPVPGSYPMSDSGVGAGIQLQGSVHSGRLVFPRNGYGFSLSDDHGATWHVGSPAPHHGESALVQLSNGSIISQMRAGHYAYAYVWCRSDDGGDNYAPICVNRTVPQVPDVPTSIVRLQSSQLLFAHPNTEHRPCPLGRANMTVSLSADEGDTWRDLLLVFSGPSGYSSLSVLQTANPTRGFMHTYPLVLGNTLDSAGHHTVGLLFEKSPDGLQPIDFQEVELVVFSL
eukprot:gene13004-biopygen7715